MRSEPVPGRLPTAVRCVAAAAICCVALVVVGALGAAIGVLGPRLGFGAFALGLGLAPLVAAGGTVVGLYKSLGRRARNVGWMATAAAGVIVLVALAIALPKRQLPRINDITTDTEAPPRLEQSDAAYPAQFAPIQRKAYPEVKTLSVDLPPARALELAQQIARSIGWNVHHVDASAGTLVATTTSRIFHFVDDIVVRVKPKAGRTHVDLRSRSRLGRGDMGANAARILLFSQKFRANLDRQPKATPSAAQSH